MPLVFYLSNGYLSGMGAWLFALAVILVVCLKLRRRRRQLGKSAGAIHALLSLWMFLAILTSLELFVALFYDQSDSFDMTNVSHRWFERHVHKNSIQFRDVPIADRTGKLWPKEFPPTDRMGRKRLVFLGDSFTFGQGVDEPDRFTDRVAAALEQTRRWEFDVHNMGGCGYGTPEVLSVLKGLLEKDARVDIAVYSVCLNDIEYQSPKTQGVNERRHLSKPSFFLFRDTYFFNMLYFRSFQFTNPEIRDYFKFVEEYYDGEPWRKMQDQLEDLCTLCRQHDVDLRIAVFPFLHNLGPDYPFRDAHHKIVEFFRTRGIRVIDLEPIYLPHVAEGLTANRFDAHPSPRAHEIAADAIQTQLLDDLFQKPN